jgi:hypothetical protein
MGNRKRLSITVIKELIGAPIGSNTNAKIRRLPIERVRTAAYVRVIRGNLRTTEKLLLMAANPETLSIATAGKA